MEKGRCFNIGGGCPKALSKEIQEADPVNFVCSHCGKPLRKVSKVKEPPIPWWKRPENRWKVILIIIAILAVLGGGAVLLYNQQAGSPNTEPEVGDTTIVDSVEIDSTTVTTPVDDTVEPGPDTTPPIIEQPVRPQPRPVFGGAATLSADGSTITFKQDYVLDLHTNDGDELYISRGDKIRGAKIQNGRLLSGEYVSTAGEERYLSGLNNKL